MNNTQELLMEKVELLSNALTLQIYWKHKVKKCLLVEWKMKDHEVDKYIEIIKIFIQNTQEVLESQFKFLKNE